MLDADSDYSENGPIANAREIQSEYWVMKTYTLFISIWSFLLVSEWLDREGALARDCAVTVEPEGHSLEGSLEPAEGSFYAQVEQGSAEVGRSVRYIVRDRAGQLHEVSRHRLRRRKRHTVAFACVSNEKRHDAPTTQHFLNRIMGYFMGHATAAPAPPLPAQQPPPYKFTRSEKFWGLVHHSDNATHFKSNQMLHYWTKVKADPPCSPSEEPQPPAAPASVTAGEPERPQEPQVRTTQQRISMLWVEFGCAGHGKGPWDGLGAMLKQTVRRDILHNTILTSSGYITSPAEVAEHLYLRFSTDDWQLNHTEKKVNEIIVLYSDATDVAERAEVERSKYDSLTGQKKTFSFLPLAKGVVALRCLSCFRPKCFGARGRGLGTMDSNLVVSDCECSGAHFSWKEQDVNRTDAGGIAERRVAAQREGKRQMEKLKPGMWLAVQDRSVTEGDSYWIGRAFAIPGKESSCVHKAVEGRSEWIGGVEFGRGDFAVAVQWWVKTTTDPEERTFEEWQPSTQDKETYGIETANNGHYFIFNSTELRLVNFSMERLTDELAPPVIRTRSTRRVRSQPAPESTAGKTFRLPVDTENQILATCW